MTEFDPNEERYTAQINVALWRRLLGFCSPYRKPLARLALCGFLMAIADAVLPWLTGVLIDKATRGDSIEGLFWPAVAFFAMGILISVLVYNFIIYAGRAATGIEHDLRKTAFDKLQELSFSYYDRHPVGWIMARLTSDAHKLASVAPWFLLDLVWGTSLILMSTIFMLLINAKLAVWVLLIVPAIGVISWVFQKRLLESQRSVRRSNAMITASFNENILGVRTSKTLVRENANLKEFQKLSTDMYLASRRNLLQSALYLPIVMTLGNVGVALALWKGGVQFGTTLQLGEIVTFMQYATFLSQPVQELAARFTQLQAAQASAERIRQLLDTEPDVLDSPEVLEKLAKPQIPGHASDGGALEVGRIEFVNIGFWYKKEETVLENFTLTVEPGESIALVGSTGSGKTTIANLLCRFYEPCEGEIRLGGVEYRQRSLAWLHSCLGIVQQTPYLFRSSVRENIRYGRLTASDAEVEEAARIVGADAFISKLENGYDTDVGESGAFLSTGQRQFVSLARAILADPQILVLDEATSSVDTETEKRIQKGIEIILQGRTSVIIAHRLSTIRAADRILVIDRGKIIEQGNHTQLIAQKGRYYSLYTQQFAKEAGANLW